MLCTGMEAVNRHEYYAAIHHRTGLLANLAAWAKTTPGPCYNPSQTDLTDLIVALPNLC